MLPLQSSALSTSYLEAEQLEGFLHNVGDATVVFDAAALLFAPPIVHRIWEGLGVDPTLGVDAAELAPLQGIHNAPEGGAIQPDPGAEALVPAEAFQGRVDEFEADAAYTTTTTSRSRGG